MKSIIVTNWTNHDLRGVRTYVTSYTLRDENKELYSLDLNKQMGFFQISEFVAANGIDHFIIEQTNRVGTAKIAAFDKNSGRMLGTFKGNQFVDMDENLIFSIERVAQLQQDGAGTTYKEEDFAAVAADDKRVIALFRPLPRQLNRGHLLRRLALSLNQFLKSGPKNVLEIVIKDEHCCDHRMLAAIGVLLHNRGGLQIDSKVTPY